MKLGHIFRSYFKYRLPRKIIRLKSRLKAHLFYICKMNFLKYFVCLFIIGSVLFSACKKDSVITSSSAKLGFSADSILFDTVFTTVGSTTKMFRVYNPNAQAINISKIRLANGSVSPFRINVDGISGTQLHDFEILAGDSLFVFVQVTVFPNNQNSPLLIKDSVIFETNGNEQHVMLTAIGQDVHLHKPDHFPTNGLPPYSIINCDETWTNDKPHLIFGYAVVDQGCKLTIMQNVKVYLNTQAVLWVYDGGTLVINGSKDQEVLFQGARLEPDYKDVAGQWGKIWLSAGSKDNVIDWAIIKNGSIGVQADTLGVSTNPTLQISNSIIKNMSAAAIYGQGTYIKGYNCVFANCGQYTAAFSIGGKYRFDQCTFANYWSGDQRTNPLLALNNYYVDYTNTLQIRDLDSAYFGNCIIYGTLDDEIGLDSSVYGGVFSYKFDHCLIKSALNTSNVAYFDGVVANLDPKFKDVTADNYHLLQGSAAIDLGTGINPLYIPIDLENMPRPNSNTTSIPDAGAYEFYP